MQPNKHLPDINSQFYEGICHRGLHGGNVPENSSEAFRLAVRANMAFELDIHLTKDGELIVCHDSDLTRVTGKGGIIEDLTAAEIRENYRLANGEVLPTLDEVLQETDERVGVVIELKCLHHNARAIAERLKQSLKRIRDRRNILLISFYPGALIPFRNAGFVRQLLISEQRAYMFCLRFWFEGVDLDWRLLKKRSVLRWAERHFTNVYTIETDEQLGACLGKAHTVTFQYLDPDAVRSALRNAKNQ